MEPSAAISIIETDLRYLVAEVREGQVGREWLVSVLGEPAVAQIEQRRHEESKKREPSVVTGDLLEYTHIREIRKCLDSLDWGRVEATLGPKRKFDSLLDLVENYRNPVAHSRQLLPYERALLEGVAGLIRTRATLHRSSMDTDQKHYPLIESARDSFGNAFAKIEPLDSMATHRTGMTLQVGDVVTFEVKGWDAQGRDLRWRIQNGLAGRKIAEGAGTDVSMDWVVQESDVAIYVSIAVVLSSSGRFHRHTHHDQMILFTYSVDPPNI